eukprot:m.1363353 g.1363353  ORF g.1363353 m.1363353 type:complete len:54 (+) comp24945_c1_seq12:442-603(+)
MHSSTCTINTCMHSQQLPRVTNRAEGLADQTVRPVPVHPSLLKVPNQRVSPVR